jgi:Uncharacterized protein conserved in bacteria (DUF2330)
MFIPRLSWVSGAALAALVFAAPDDAAACGGTFCDSGPSTMPVDQSGENILFVMDGQNVEAHVQIQYQGSAARFAWIVPMPEIPEVSVGSQALFDNLLQGTVPSYGFQLKPDQCGGNKNGGFATGAGGGGGSGGGLNAGSDGGPSVVYDKVVGAFEVVVLQGGTAQEVSDWLAFNNYQTIANAPAILDDYVKKNFVFVAIKLTGGASTEEIHPLVFKYPGNTPCVPLELTAVAATEDMGVRAFFLGDDRVVPTNYKHVVLNPVRIDWTAMGSNYAQVVSRAVDTPVADGHAFITEYAGPSNVVQSFGVFSPSWDGAAFDSIDPTLVIDELSQQGLAYCYPGYCQFNHPLLLSLLHSYLPVPAGMTDESFYSCLSCNAAQIDMAVWNAAGFAKDFADRIVTPGKHAQDVLGKYPYLTRLFTAISPGEMTVDPEFAIDPDVSGESVSNAAQIASERLTCDGQRGVTLPDGREVGLGTQAVWPAFSSTMPWAERIEDYSAGGPPVVLVDNKDTIDGSLADWNKAVGWPPPDARAQDAMTDSSGCACSAPGAQGSRWAALAALGCLFAFNAARRRRRM